MNILVIDDEQLTLTAIENQLKMESHTVTTCNDGLEAVKSIQNDKFDLIISDIAMPHVNGLEVLNYSKSNLDSITPVMLISGMDQKELIDTAISLGADDFIVKPLNMDELSMRVKRFEPKSSS